MQLELRMPIMKVIKINLASFIPSWTHFWARKRVVIWLPKTTSRRQSTTRTWLCQQTSKAEKTLFWKAALFLNPVCHRTIPNKVQLWQKRGASWMLSSWAIWRGRLYLWITILSVDFNSQAALSCKPLVPSSQLKYPTLERSLKLWRKATAPNNLLRATAFSNSGRLTLSCSFKIQQASWTQQL